MTKSRAFVVTLFAILIMFTAICILLLLKIDIDKIPIGAFLTAVVSLGAGFMGIQVANNGVRGKFYNEGVREADARKL